MNCHPCLRSALLALGLLNGAALAAAQAPGQSPGKYVFYEVGDAVKQASNLASAPTPAGDCSCPSGECDCGPTGGCGCGGLGGSGECGCGACSACAGEENLLGGVPLSRRSGEWFFGADYLNVRASPGDSTAYLPQDITNFVDTFVTFDFEYGSAYRLFGGYRFSDCCGEVMFTYTRINSDAREFCPPVAGSGALQCIAPLEVIAVVAGDSLETTAAVDLKTYDIDFARTIPLGSPLCDQSACWCPAWDIKYFAGVRAADLSFVRFAESFDSMGATRRTGRTSMEFEGGGLRFGLDGRRYIGRSGWASVFAKGTVNVLLGDVNMFSIQSDVATPGVTPITQASFTRVIPVTDLEVGGSVHWRSATFSAGYLLSAWHDVGRNTEYDFGLQIQYDDGNILGFDGWFARAEIAY